MREDGSGPGLLGPISESKESELELLGPGGEVRHSILGVPGSPCTGR